MLKIEKILTDNGFKLIDGLGHYSSIIIGGVCSIYSDGKINVVVGLNEKGYPPSLINPRPIIKEKTPNYNYSRLMNDGEIIDWIVKSEDNEILNFIQNCGKPKQR